MMKKAHDALSHGVKAFSLNYIHAQPADLLERKWLGRIFY
jgi:hypothetical protein